MRNLFAVLSLSAAVALSSCGGKKDPNADADAKKREADSLAAIEKAKQDSIAAANAAPKLVNVVQTAMADTQFTTLVDLIKTAGLVDKLSDSTANFTVFAPTNDAFRKLGAKKLDALKTAAKAQELTDILTYHVVVGKLASTDLANVAELDALDEKVIKVTNKDGKVMVSNATVTTADVQASNGIIHVVDAVLAVPAKKSKAKTPTTTTPTTSTPTTSTPTTGRGNTGTETKVDGRGTTGTQTKVDGRGTK